MKLFLLCLSLFTLPAWADQDADFLAMRDAYRAKNVRRVENYAQQLRHHDLELYARYYQLSVNLENADASDVRQFLARHEDSPLMDKLRGEWLKVLGKQQKWTLFNNEYPKLVNSDSELACYALQSRYTNSTKDVLREARMLWFTGKDMPSSCAPLFEAALSAGVISEDDAWQRFKLALEANNLSVARRIIERLSPQRSVAPAQLDAAAKSPTRYLSKLAPNHPREGQRAVMLFALQRIAKQSPDLALTYWDASIYTTEERQYFYTWLGYEGARKQDDQALKWFKMGSNNLNENQLAWRVRAALRAKNWGEVLNSVNMMSETQQRDPAWRYWKGRALLAQGKSAEAAKIFAPLSNEFNFYGQLANEELTKNAVVGNVSQNIPVNSRLLERIAALPSVQRTVTLYRLDLRSEATKEWAWLLRDFSDQELLAAAEFARRNQMFDRAIGAADKTVSTHDFNLRYLAPYRDALQPHLIENDLDEAWVYGLMRQESRFANIAKSNVGASGLMQIMPATARWVARKIGLRDYRDSMIADLNTNLKLGTFYMRNVLSTFDNSPVLASAAYNAGPGRARQWRGDQTLEGAIYAETIPFDETRDYVKKVMSNTAYYAIQFGAPSRSLKTRLGMIAARNPDNQRAIPDEK